jgi:hypothetical protein
LDVNGGHFEHQQEELEGISVVPSLIDTVDSCA